MLETNSRKRIRRKKNINKSIIILVSCVVLMFGIASVIYYFKDSSLKYLKINGNENYSKRIFDKQLNRLETDLNIQEVKYKWASDLNEENIPNKIIVHHAAGNNFTPEKIHEMHLEKDYQGIGYHFYIRKDGTIYRGRPENAEGAHTIGENKSSIGVCLEGNFDTDALNENQKNALEKLSEYLVIKYDIEKIDGHQDYYNTRCPGKNISLEGINQDVKNRLIELADKK